MSEELSGRARGRGGRGKRKPAQQQQQAPGRVQQPTPGSAQQPAQGRAQQPAQGHAQQPEQGRAQQLVPGGSQQQAPGHAQQMASSGAQQPAQGHAQQLVPGGGQPMRPQSVQPQPSGAGVSTSGQTGGKGRGWGVASPAPEPVATTAAPANTQGVGAWSSGQPGGRGRGLATGSQAPVPSSAAMQQAVAHPGGQGDRGASEKPPGSGDVLATDLSRLNVRDPSKLRPLPYEKYQDKAYKDKSKNSHGSFGTAIQIITNYFKVSLPSEFKIYQYHVDFKPDVENIRVKFALISSLEVVRETVKCFDGGILYLSRLLPDEVNAYNTTRSFDGAIIRVEIKRVAEVFSNSPQFRQIVNILFKRVLTALDMKQIRDHYYNPTLSILIRNHKLEVMPGFTTSILNYEAGNLLGVDIIHKIIRMDTFLDCLYNLYHSMQDNKDVRAFHAAAMKNFVGTIVITRYNNKTYRVDDINWEGRPTQKFEKGGDQISYVTYFKQRWNIDVHDKDQPLLVTRPTERDKRRGDKQNLHLLPELCTITGLSEEVRNNFNVMKDLAVHTRIGPEKRLETLENFLKQINENEKVRKDILGPWQIKFDTQAFHIPARQLPPENILLRGANGAITKITYDIKEADWSRNMRNCTLLNAVTMDQWLLVYPHKLAESANELTGCLYTVGRGVGMRISEPTRVELANDRNDAYLQGIIKNLNQTIQMVVVVAPNNKKDRYDAVKRSCCIDNPVPSQVVLARTLDKKQGLMSVATKIAIQMNCKMGGEVWSVDIPLQNFMVIGIDSYHDSANKGQSVGAFVASLNKECTRYYSMTEYHPSGSDLLNGITTLLSVSLKKYHEVNNALPQKIIFYRDGVGDGQLEQVFHHECEQVFAAYKAVGGENYRPNTAYVIVKKRINTRLFGMEKNKTIANPLPGTIVDSHITKPDWYDFFIVSQSVRQGTVSPTSYNVIYDTSGLKADYMQNLAYKLTHMYFNWQGTIRVPAPCQYAHKLAFLQGQSLHRQFSAHLADKLFYL